MLASATGLRRRIEPINLDQGSTVPLGFVFELADKLAPANITDRFCKAVVLDHVLDSQALHANHLVFVYYACAELVLVISPAILDTSVDVGNFQPSFVSVPRSLLFLGMSPLSFCQLLLILGKELRIANTFTCGDGNHRRNTKIESNHVVGHFQRFDVFLYQDRDEIAIRTILGHTDRAGFGVLWEGSMPVDIQGSVHFCQRQRGTIPLEGISGIGSRLCILLFLEGGILGTSLEKVFEGSVQMSQGLLHRHRGNLSQPGVSLLEVRQLCRKIIVGELLTTLFVGRRAEMQAPVGDKADTAERLSKISSLLFSRIEAILVCPLGLLAHGLFALLISFDVLFQSGQHFSAQRAVVPFCNLFHLLQDVSRETDGERFDGFFFVPHASIVQQKWMHVN